MQRQICRDRALLLELRLMEQYLQCTALNSISFPISGWLSSWEGWDVRLNIPINHAQTSQLWLLIFQLTRSATSTFRIWNLWSAASEKWNVEYMVIKREYVAVFMGLLVLKFLILPKDASKHPAIAWSFYPLGNSCLLCSGGEREVGLRRWIHTK